MKTYMIMWWCIALTPRWLVYYYNVYSSVYLLNIMFLGVPLANATAFTQLHYVDKMQVPYRTCRV